ncbi:MAG: hypothetical protein R8K48_07885 [Gallionella sp.]
MRLAENLLKARACQSARGQDMSEADLNALQHPFENATPLADDELAEVALLSGDACQISIYGVVR